MCSTIQYNAGEKLSGAEENHYLIYEEESIAEEKANSKAPNTEELQQIASTSIGLMGDKVLAPALRSRLRAHS